jgi:hypothetical protein
VGSKSSFISQTNFHHIFGIVTFWFVNLAFSAITNGTFLFNCWLADCLHQRSIFFCLKISRNWLCFILIEFFQQVRDQWANDRKLQLFDLDYPPKFNCSNEAHFKYIHALFSMASRDWIINCLPIMAILDPTLAQLKVNIFKVEYLLAFIFVVNFNFMI